MKISDGKYFTKPQILHIIYSLSSLHTSILNKFTYKFSAANFG